MATSAQQGIPVQLGARTYHVVPQRIGRIGRRISAIATLEGVTSGDGDGEISDRLYDALEVFIPDLAPRSELAGYASDDDYAKVQGHAAAVEAARQEYAAAFGAEEGADPPQRWEDLTDAERDAFEAPVLDDPYDEAHDKSPTPPEIIGAIETIFEVHGGQRLVRLLKGVVGEEAIRAIIRREVLRWASDRSLTAPSPSDGAEASTTSTTTAPTPGEPASAA